MAWELRGGRPFYLTGGDRYALQLHRVGGFEGASASFQDTIDAERELAKLISGAAGQEDDQQDHGDDDQDGQ